MVNIFINPFFSSNKKLLRVKKPFTLKFRLEMPIDIMKNPFKNSVGTRIRDRYIINLLKLKKGDNILDLGCGIGYHSEFLSSFGVTVTGIDISKEAINLAKRFYPTFNFLISSATDIPYKANSFDKVLCSEVLEHINDDTSVIQEIYRVTKPGGLILLTIPSPEGIFGSRTKNIGHNKEFEKHIRDGYSMKTIRSLCERNGLILLNYNYTMVLFVELYMCLKKKVYILINKSELKGQSELVNFKQNSLLAKLNTMFLPLFLKIGIIEDKLLSRIIKGHMLILLLIKK